MTKQVFQAAMSGGHGLGLFMAIIFLAGEMAGVGVLALPRSMVGTGKFPSQMNVCCKA